MMGSWEKLGAWESRIKAARQKQRPGDILVLADESPIQALRLEAYRTAGKALMDLGTFSFGLVEKALSFDTKDLIASQYRGILLGRLKKFESAKEWMRSLVENPKDSETLALLGTDILLMSLSRRFMKIALDRLYNVLSEL